MKLSKLKLPLILFSFSFNILYLPTICESKTEFSFEQQAKLYAYKGYMNRKKGNITEAIKYLQKATYLNPDFAFPHNELGIVYESKGWLDRAEKEYKEAIRIDPEFLSAYMNLALFYESKGNIKNAIFYWKKRIELASFKDEWTALSIKKLKQYAPKQLLSIVNPKITREISGFEKTEQKISPPKESKKKQIAKSVKTKKKEVTLKIKPEEKKEEKIKEKKERKPEKNKKKKKIEGEKIGKEFSVFEQEKLREAKEVSEEAIKDIEKEIFLSKQAEVKTLVKSARDFLQQGEFELALDKLYLAQKLDPENVEVELLIDAIRLAQLDSQKEE